MSQEIEALHGEREAMINRSREIEVRLHQLVGAIYEMQQLMSHLDRQPSGPPDSLIEFEIPQKKD
jgi:hypothetical protein